jgi:hypothetical protein
MSSPVPSSSPLSSPSSSPVPSAEVDTMRLKVQSRLDKDNITEADFAKLIQEPASKLHSFMQSKPGQGKRSAMYKALVCFFEKETTSILATESPPVPVQDATPDKQDGQNENVTSSPSQVEDEKVHAEMNTPDASEAITHTNKRQRTVKSKSG